MSSYFDYNATTPLAAEVYGEMQPYWTQHFGNPSSLHQAGKIAAQAIRTARLEVASFLGAADSREIVFTSGGTESNNTALRAALALSDEKKEIVTSAVEHSSINKLCAQLEREGYRVKRIPVDSEGQLRFDLLSQALSHETAVVSLMMANNETGVLFPIEKAGVLIKEMGILFHVDAVQAAAKYPLVLKKSQVDFLSISAHKFYGPKGAGALYVKNGIPYQALMFGGAQERGRRAGTENVAGIVGLGAAAKLASKTLQENIRHMQQLRDLLEQKIKSEVTGVWVNGDKSERLPNTSNIYFEGVDGEALLFILDQKGICASSGSACMSGAREPSHVLKAMGFTDERANGSIRLSLGAYTQAADVDLLVSILKQVVSELRTINLEEQHTH